MLAFWLDIRPVRLRSTFLSLWSLYKYRSWEGRTLVDFPQQHCHWSSDCPHSAAREMFESSDHQFRSVCVISCHRNPTDCTSGLPRDRPLGLRPRRRLWKRPPYPSNYVGQTRGCSCWGESHVCQKTVRWCREACLRGVHPPRGKRSVRHTEDWPTRWSSYPLRLETGSLKSMW